MLRKSIQIQDNVISEESRLVVAWGWVRGMGDQGHEANVGSSLYVLILILLLFWIYTCVKPYWTAHFRCGFFFFFKPHLYIHKAVIKAAQSEGYEAQISLVGADSWSPWCHGKSIPLVPHAGCPWCTRAVVLPERLPGILRLWKWETLTSNRW